MNKKKFSKDFQLMSEEFHPSDATSASQLHKILARTPRYVPNDTCIRLEDIINYNSLDSLFGARYFKVVYLSGENEIGHFCLLSHLDPHTVEWFDSAGRHPPDLIAAWARAVGVTTIRYSKVALQDENSFHCGRFVLARISSQPTSLEVFTNILLSSTVFSPDEFVSALFNVDSE